MEFMTLNKQIDKTEIPVIFNDNGHKTFTWAFNLKEKVLQFWNQLTRTNKTQLQVLKNILNGILIDASNKLNSVSSIEKTEGKDVLVLMYKMIAQTRDIKNGKGEYLLSYMMIRVWFDYFPEAAYNALDLFVKSPLSSTERPYGSWKDIKYFCNYCRNEEKLKDTHTLIIAPLMMMNEQLKKDYENIDRGEEISYAAKWVPREKSKKFGWQFEMLAHCYFSEYFGECSTTTEFKGAMKKAKMELRKIVSKLNRKLETPQVTMCNDLWDTICINNLSSRTIFKNQNALLNINSNGERRYYSQDRSACASQFKEYIEASVSNNGCKIKGNNIEIYEFVKKAYDILEEKEKGVVSEEIYQIKSNLLQGQWNDYAEKVSTLRECIAFVDFSLSMDPLSLYSSIGLACLILGKSTFGKGLMIFSDKCKWINLENKYEKGFVEMIGEIKRESETGFQRTHSNIYSALNSVTDVIIKNKLSDTYFSDVNFVILSNMKFEMDKYNSINNLSKNIETIFEKTSVEKKISQPYFVLWNMESSNEFMVEGIADKFIIFSGYKKCALNSLSVNEGFKSNKNALQLVNPWEIFLQVINATRYDRMEFFMRHVINRI